jgi:hypothetical protein
MRTRIADLIRDATDIISASADAAPPFGGAFLSN